MGGIMMTNDNDDDQICCGTGREGNDRKQEILWRTTLQNCRTDQGDDGVEDDDNDEGNDEDQLDDNQATKCPGGEVECK